MLAAKALPRIVYIIVMKCYLDIADAAVYIRYIENLLRQKFGATFLDLNLINQKRTFVLKYISIFFFKLTSLLPNDFSANNEGRDNTYSSDGF